MSGHCRFFSPQNVGLTVWGGIRRLPHSGNVPNNALVPRRRRLRSCRTGRSGTARPTPPPPIPPSHPAVPDARQRGPSLRRPGEEPAGERTGPLSSLPVMSFHSEGPHECEKPGREVRPTPTIPTVRPLRSQARRLPIIGGPSPTLRFARRSSSPCLSHRSQPDRPTMKRRGGS